VPHGYPKEAPLVYDTPVEGMMVRPGQHVDPQGKIYHPYLVRWAEFWDVSSYHEVDTPIDSMLIFALYLEVEHP